MHAQGKEDQGKAGGGVLDVGGARGAALYLATAAAELAIGGTARWLGAALAATVVALVQELPCEASTFGWVAALAPLCWSALGAVAPGRGRVWAMREGGRRPTADELERWEDALAILEGERAGRRWLATLRVLDDERPMARVRGRCMLVTRGALEDPVLPALVAHELGHVETLDGRVCEALARLAMWDDPLRPSEAEYEPDWFKTLPERAADAIWGCLRWWLRLAGGAAAQRLLVLAWAAHWRSREFAADAYAAALGQGEELARHLEEFELPFQEPVTWRSAHPPLAHRIERLRGE